MENNIQIDNEKMKIKKYKLMKYLASSTFLSWVLISLVFTVSISAHAGTKSGN